MFHNFSVKISFSLLSAGLNQSQLPSHHNHCKNKGLSAEIVIGRLTNNTGTPMLEWPCIRLWPTVAHVIGEVPLKCNMFVTK